MLPPNIASRPTAPLARAGGGETRFGACLLAKGVSTQSARRLMLIVGRRGATERTWTLPGETRAEVSQLYPSRVQSVGHSSSGAAKAPAVVGRRPTSLQGRRGYRRRSAAGKHGRRGLLSQVVRRLRRAA